MVEVRGGGVVTLWSYSLTDSGRLTLYSSLLLIIASHFVDSTHASIIHIIVAYLSHASLPPCYFVWLLQCYPIRSTTYNYLLFPFQFVSIVLVFFILLVVWCYYSLYFACLRPPPHYFLYYRLTTFPFFYLYPRSASAPSCRPAELCFFCRWLMMATVAGKTARTAATCWALTLVGGRLQTRQSATTPPLQCIGGVVADCGVYFTLE